MAFIYNKLWKILIDKRIKKTKLEKLAGISHSTMSKLAKGKNVNTIILEKICLALNCDIGDIMELEEKNNGQN